MVTSMCGEKKAFLSLPGERDHWRLKADSSERRLCVSVLFSTGFSLGMFLYVGML